jgi:hypothetical protein
VHTLVTALALNSRKYAAVLPALLAAHDKSANGAGCCVRSMGAMAT